MGKTTKITHAQLLASRQPCLSERENQVALLLAIGKTNREIADELEISIKTIDTHRGHVLAKLRVRNNVDLARYAVRIGAISLDDENPISGGTGKMLAYSVQWSDEDKAYVGTVAEYPSLSWLDVTRRATLSGIVNIVAEVRAQLAAEAAAETASAA